MTCEFCGRGAHDVKWHAACHAEWRRRQKESVCTRCGTADVGPTEWHCDVCGSLAPYAGYPGGGA